MINVVFLLLIFFMISSELAPAPPFDVRPPETGQTATEAGEDDTLYLSATGEIAWRDLRGDAAILALAARGDAPLELRADGAAPARDVAVLLRRLAVAGVGDVRLATRPAAP
jgi:biopolymer transport protein ExbD